MTHLAALADLAERAAAAGAAAHAGYPGDVRSKVEPGNLAPPRRDQPALFATVAPATDGGAAPDAPGL